MERCRERELERWTRREGGRGREGEGGREEERGTRREGGREGGGVRSRTSKDKLKPERKERHRDIGGHGTAVEVTDGHDIVTHR